jgi:hypothetical protein
MSGEPHYLSHRDHPSWGGNSIDFTPFPARAAPDV